MARAEKVGLLSVLAVAEHIIYIFVALALIVPIVMLFVSAAIYRRSAPGVRGMAAGGPSTPLAHAVGAVGLVTSSRAGEGPGTLNRRHRGKPIPRDWKTKNRS
jgi:hypothetical protein